MSKVRILLADDHDLIRGGLRTVIESEFGWEICGEASTGREAVAMAEKLRPQIVILDVGMPDLNGIDATRQIKRALPDTEVLILTGDRSEEIVHQVLAAGARGYLVKSDAGNEIIPAIKALCAHKPYLTAGADKIVLDSYLKGGIEPAQATPGGLSPREREIVQLLAEGQSNKEVAGRLGISVATVETHRAAVMRKLGFKAFSELVRFAVRNHLVEG